MLGCSAAGVSARPGGGVNRSAATSPSSSGRGHHATCCTVPHALPHHAPATRASSVLSKADDGPQNVSGVPDKPILRRPVRPVGDPPPSGGIGPKGPAPLPSAQSGPTNFPLLLADHRLLNAALSGTHDVHVLLGILASATRGDELCGFNAVNACTTFHRLAKVRCSALPASLARVTHLA